MRHRFACCLLSLLIGFSQLGHFVETQYPDPVAGLPATPTRDVIYCRKSGMALDRDVFKPKTDENGAAVIFVVSGG